MAYSPVNSQVFAAAFSGAVAGMISAQRFNTNTTSTSYDGFVAAAGAFAQEFDTTWGSAAANTMQLEVIEQVCRSTWEGRPQTSTTVASYLTTVNAIIALVQSCVAYYAAQTIVNPQAGNSGVVKSTIAFNPGALASGSNTVSIPLVGALATDGAVVNPPATLADTIFVVQVHAGADAISVVLYNSTGAPISPGSANWLVTRFVSAA